MGYILFSIQPFLYYDTLLFENKPMKVKVILKASYQKVKHFSFYWLLSVPYKDLKCYFESSWLNSFLIVFERIDLWQMYHSIAVKWKLYCENSVLYLGKLLSINENVHITSKFPSKGVSFLLLLLKLSPMILLLLLFSEKFSWRLNFQIPYNTFVWAFEQNKLHLPSASPLY